MISDIRDEGPITIIREKPVSSNKKLEYTKVHNSNEMYLTPGLAMYPKDNSYNPQQLRIPKCLEISNIMVSQLDGNRGVVRPLDLSEYREDIENLQQDGSPALPLPSNDG